jgi:Fanconi anemia group M protein
MMKSDLVNHPMVVPGALEDRAYQRTISEHAARENLLVVLPTGLGKTAIALRLIAEWAERDPRHSALFLAPTRPLVEQHAKTIRQSLRLPEPVVLTGTLTPGRRHGLVSPPQVVVATPQVIRNDIASGALDIGLFSLVVFDEAHRAVGNYPYVDIASAFKNVTGGRTLGITASPGSRIERLREVMEHLGVATTGLEVRDGSEPDVLPYLFGIKVEPVYVDRPKALSDVSGLLKHALENHVSALGQYYRLPVPVTTSKKSILDAGNALVALKERLRATGEDVPRGLWQAQVQMAVAMKISHALELIDTQGVDSLQHYLERMKAPEKRRSTSTRAFLGDDDVRGAMELLDRARTEHPKVAKTVELVRDELILREGSKVIVFAHFRDMAELLTRKLTEIGDPLIRPARFVGQATRSASDEGLKQKQQVALLEDFRSGKINCLVATSVAEEGLDVPSTDLVIFYEPVSSEIRTIQRRGRTGRSRAGKVVVLLTRGTQDVSAHFSSRGKEWKMKRLIEELKGTGSPNPQSRGKGQTHLDSFS